MSIFFIGCDKKDEYLLSKEDVLKINSSFNGDRIDMMGAEGPYRWTGSHGFPQEAGGTMWINMDGVKVKKELPKLNERESYVIEAFENVKEEGFIVVYKLSLIHI